MRAWRRSAGLTGDSERTRLGLLAKL